MVARVRSRREPGGAPGRRPKKKRGRKPGGVNEVRRVAAARAALTGKMPDELLLEWGRTGVIASLSKKRSIELDASQIIDCMKAAAKFYCAPVQPRPAEGQQPPTYRVELDAAQLAGLPADMLTVFQKVLQMMAKGMPGMAELVPAPRADPAAYARTLRPDSKTEGRA